MRLGNTALSQYGGCPSGGDEAPKNVFKFKNKRDSMYYFHKSTSLGWSLLSNHLIFYSKLMIDLTLKKRGLTSE